MKESPKSKSEENSLENEPKLPTMEFLATLNDTIFLIEDDKTLENII